MTRRASSISSRLNSDEKLLGILDLTDKYLAEAAHEVIGREIEDRLRVYRSLLDLVPETIEQFWSGHIFPLLEGEYELESSIFFCKLGFYKHAIGALRNLLELGLLSVYWDVDGQSHIDIQGWLNSHKTTPFRSAVFTKLKTNSNIRSFDEKHGLFDETAGLYQELCNFAHTKGLKFSSRALSNTNVNTFQEESLKKWFIFMNRVVKAVVAFHVLKFPVGLQDTPLDDKFGLNGPLGGFLRPDQAERIRNIYSPEVAEALQKISDNDSDARSMAAWVNEMPDLTEEDWHAQIEAADKREIKTSGFDQWLKNQKQLLKLMHQTDAASYSRRLKAIESLKAWAEENGLLKRGLRTMPRNRGSS